MSQGAASYSTQSKGPSPEPVIHHEFEPVTGTWQYIVADPSSGRAAIIDPVLDYEPAAQLITTATADSLLSLVKEKGYTIDWILETHAHADHLTAASYLQTRLAEEQGGQKPVIAIGARINKVQELFGERYGIPAKEYNMVFDTLFGDDETFSIGSLEATTTHLPGHTPDHLGYKIGGKSRHPPVAHAHLLKLCQITYSAVTPSSTPTSAPPDATSPEAARRTSGHQPASFSASQIM